MLPWPELWDPTGTQRVAILNGAFNVQVTDELLTDSAGQEVLDFSMPLNDPKAALIENEMLIRVAVTNETGPGRVDVLFAVRTPADVQDQSGSKVRTFKAEARWYELGTAEPLVMQVPAPNPTMAMTHILAGTDWVIGEITVSPPSGALFRLDSLTTPLAALRALPAVFGGELVFDTIGRTVSLVPSRGDPATGIVYRYAHNVTAATRTVDTTNLVTRAHPIGANGLDVSLVAPGGVPYIEDYSYFDDRGWPRQIRSAALQNDQVTDPIALLAWAQAELTRRAQPTVTYSVSVALLRGERMPAVGDTIRIIDKALGLDRYARIAQRVLNVLQPHLSTVQVDTSLRLLTDAIPGVPGSAAGRGIAGSVDQTIPGDPTDLDAHFGDAVDANGNHVVYAVVTWVGSADNADGTPMVDFDHFDMRYRIEGETAWTSGGSTALSSAATGLIWQSGTLQAQVRAVDKSGHTSAWVEGDFPVTDPSIEYEAPSPPILDTSLPSAIRASWDGLTASGVTPPADMAFCEVHVSTSPFGVGVGQIQPSQTTLVDQLPAAGAAPLIGLVPGTTYHVCFRFRGRTGIPGLVSEDRYAQPRLIGGPDLDPRAITDTDHSAFLNADVDFPSGGAVVTDGAAPDGEARLLVGGETATSTPYTALKPGRYRATFLLSNAAAVSAQSTLLGSVSVSPAAGVVPDALRSVFVSDLVASSDYRTVSVNFTVTAAPANVSLVVSAAAGQSIKVAAAYVQPVLIAAGLEVQAAMIGSVLADSIVAGSLRADISVLARIKTADTGARAEINGTGIFLYDAGNNVVVGLPITGGATFKGAITSGSSITGTLFQTGTGSPAFVLGPDAPGDPMSRVGIVIRSNQIGDPRITDYYYLTTGSPDFNTGVRISGGLANLDTAIDAPSQYWYLDNHIIVYPRDRTDEHYSEDIGQGIEFQIGHDTAGSGSKIYRYVMVTHPTGSAATDYPLFGGGTQLTAIGFDDAELKVVNFPVSGYQNVHAANVAVPSSAAVKDAVEEFDHLAVVRGAPARRFRYRAGVGHPTTEDRHGPMAEDLPSTLHVETSDIDGRPIVGVDLIRQHGVLWGAVHQLALRSEEQARQIEELLGRTG